MIKNIIFDVGGIIFDDSKENIERILNKNCDLIYKKSYGSNFKKCLLGKMSLQEHINTFIDDKDYNDIKYILDKHNFNLSYPLLKENFDYIKNLKRNGYRLYLLTNITKDSYDYINEVININSIFDGGVYSYKENLIKPDKNIYELLINRFNLVKEETIFFDDKNKNVLSAIDCGINSYVFRSMDDVKNNL